MIILRFEPYFDFKDFVILFMQICDTLGSGVKDGVQPHYSVEFVLFQCNFTEFGPLVP